MKTTNNMVEKRSTTQKKCRIKTKYNFAALWCSGFLHAHQSMFDFDEKMRSQTFFIKEKHSLYTQTIQCTVFIEQQTFRSRHSKWRPNNSLIRIHMSRW